MRRLIGMIGCASALLMTGPAFGQRSWIVQPTELQGGGWVHVSGGGYNGADYDYGSGFDGVRRGYWKFEAPFAASSPSTDDPPLAPALYYIEQWGPSIKPPGVTTWNWLPIEVNFLGKDSGEEGVKIDSIPWSGAYGTNHQWLGMNQSVVGDFEQAGRGPQAPFDSTCGAPPNGLHVWMRKGSWLYTKWNFVFGATHAITALRITEAFPPGPPPPCGPAGAGGPVDLRCVGNADPLYQDGEYYVRSTEMTVDGNSLGVQGYRKPTCFTPNAALEPGLPADGLYTAHVPTDDAGFQLIYDGLNTIKWRDDSEGTFSRYNVVTLNEVAGREFVPRRYDKLHFLSVKSSGSNGKLRIEARYADDSSDIFLANLYDWFGQDGDAGSLAVGNTGHLRSAGDPGFRRLNDNGAPGNGGDEGGAFFFVHTVTVNKNKTLAQVRLSIEDVDSFDGEFCIVAAAFAPGVPCASPVFDVLGGVPDETGLAPDGAVDQLDFAAFQRCVKRSSDPFPEESCVCFDVTDDQAIDADDFAFFVACATGPTPANPPPTGCDQP